ncbi:hypothetical protein Tco_0408689 [Tanacetum coccineum]
MCSDDDMEKMVVTCKAVNPSGGDGGVILAGQCGRPVEEEEALKGWNNEGARGRAYVVVKGTEARGMVHALVGGETNQNLNNMEDDIDA